MAGTQAIDMLAPLIEAAIEDSQAEQARWQLEADAEAEDQLRREQQYWEDYHQGLYPEATN